METSKIGRNGTLVIPAKLRRRFGLAEGGMVVIEETDDGISIRPAVAMAVEVYSSRRRAEFLLTGDRAHFGALYGKTISGVKILPPANFLKTR